MITESDVKTARRLYKAALANSNVDAAEVQRLFDDFITKYTAFTSSKLTVDEPTTFLEETSGMTLRLDRWYIVSDAGGMYCQSTRSEDGFVTSQAAVDWADTAIAKELYGADFKVCVPHFISPEKGWDELDAANVMLGRDMKSFQDYQDALVFKLLRQ